MEAIRITEAMRPEQSEFVLSNARVVMRDEVLRGAVCVRQGRIADVSAGATRGPATDLAGDYLVPGLIEMHTDNLERHLVPRPGVEWPSAVAALMAHDVQTSGAGITTVFDSIFVGEALGGGCRSNLLTRSIKAINRAREYDLLRADHMLHLRCELADARMPELFKIHVNEPILRLVSIMDHTPGQRQWHDISKWRAFHKDKKWTDEDAERILQWRKGMQEKHAADNRELVTGVCRERGIPMASHDDTTIEHVLEAAHAGIAISEFPTTLVAARKAREMGISVTMGAPNVVRGGSHSGNVSALELAAEGLLNALSSDYAPKSLLHGAFLLHQKAGLPLPDALAMVSSNLAEVLGLDDRGRIAPDMRADMVRVRMLDDIPIVRTVWREGDRVA